LNRVKVLLLCLFGALLIVGAGVAFGVAPLSGGRESARPPCEQLPDRKAVADAVASHEDLVARVENVGSGVKVDVATPCEGQPDKAIVRIEYTTDAEWEGVNAILQREDGFGVPVELVSG
jgi:hypothetical protein